MCDSIKIVLFVGNLVPVKGPDVMLRSFGALVKSEKLKVKSVEGEDRQQTTDCRPETGDHRLETTQEELREDTQRYRPTDPRTYSTHGSNSEQRTLNQEPLPPYPLPLASSLQLLIIGSGPMRSELEKLAEELGIAEQVTFLGSRPHEEVALWMNIADCLCLTSRSEGMPNVVIEALASGCPVVATDVGACRELLEGEESCALVQRAESGEQRAESGATISTFNFQLSTLHIADALADLLSRNDIERQAMAERNGRRFSWNKQARKILELIAKNAKRE